MAEFLRWSNVKKTRKPHRCFACNDMIPEGSLAYEWVSEDCGRVFSTYVHDKCGEMVQKHCFQCQECADLDEFAEGFIKESASCKYNCEPVKVYLSGKAAEGGVE